MLAIHATDALVQKYQELLRREWNRAFPDEVLALLWSTLAGTRWPTLGLPRGLFDPASTEELPADSLRALIRRIDQGTRYLDLSDLPALPETYLPPPRPARLVRQALRLANYLTIQGVTALAGNVGFFQDLQALAFQAALHVALPKIRESHPAEHALLLHALLLFPLEYFNRDPAHYCYLVAAIHGYLGAEQQRLRYLQASFRFTPREDHSYLTKAQELWSELLDQRQDAEAERFLFALHSSALPAQQEEVREMVLEALQHTRANSRS